jgi:hypothetical protein
MHFLADLSYTSSDVLPPVSVIAERITLCAADISGPQNIKRFASSRTRPRSLTNVGKGESGS